MSEQPDARLVILAEQIADRWLTHGSKRWQDVRAFALARAQEAFALGAQSPSGIRQQARVDIAKWAEAHARKYEGDASVAGTQVRRVPEEQLAKIKAGHWRLLASALLSSQEEG